MSQQMEEGSRQTSATRPVERGSGGPAGSPAVVAKGTGGRGGTAAAWTSPYASLVIQEPRPVSSSSPLPTAPLHALSTTSASSSTTVTPSTASLNQDWTAARLGITLPGSNSSNTATAARRSSDDGVRTPSSEELVARRGSEPVIRIAVDGGPPNSSYRSQGTWSHQRASTSPSPTSPSSASTLAPPTPTLSAHAPTLSTSSTAVASFRMTRSTSFGSTPSPTSTASSTSYNCGYPAANGRWIRDSDSSSICSSSSSRSTGAGSSSSFTYPFHGPAGDKVTRSNSFGSTRPVVEDDAGEGPGGEEESVEGEGEGEVYKLRESSIPDFLDPRPDPLGVELSISRDDPSHIIIRVSLPGFELTNITVAMRRGRRVHIVADKWGDGGGHFEKLISLGPDVSSSTPRAEFNGTILLVYIARRLSQSSARPKSASDAAPRPLSSTIVGPEAAKAAAKRAKEEATRRAKEDASHLPKPLVSPRLPMSAAHSVPSPSTFAHAFEAAQTTTNPWDATPGWEGKGLERNGTVTRENYVRGDSDRSVSTVASNDSSGSAGESVTGSVAESVGSAGSTDPIHPRRQSFTSLDADDLDPFNISASSSPPILLPDNPPSPPITTISTTAPPPPRPSYLKNPQNLTLRPTEVGTTFLEAVTSGLRLVEGGEETPRGEKEEFVGQAF